MNRPAKFTRPGLETLFALFPPAGDVPEYEFVPDDEVPPPYRELLVHEHHMTVTVEKYHGDLVDVRILNRQMDDDCYARKILLALKRTGQVVQFGIMRVKMDLCSPEVQAKIRAGDTPLGRILIEHDVLRRIEPTAFLRVIPGKPMLDWFGLDRPLPTYGRLAVIHCNGQPAVELLEIVAPASL
jgi:chorismate-pyruvate lyase